MLHHYRFGGVKAWSALEVVFRVVVKARRCIAKGSDIAWGFLDVKGGFQNVIKGDVMQRMEESEGGRQWKK